MSFPDDAALAREATSLKAILLATAVTLFGVFAAGLSSRIEAQWLQAVAIALATTIVSTGALSLLFELALRRSVYREMLRIVSVQKSLTENHLVAAGRSSSINWPLLLKNKTKYQMVLSDPARWIDQSLYLALDTGKQQRIDITLLVPDPTSLNVAALAKYLDMEVPVYLGSIQTALGTIERQWKARRDAGNLIRGSSISVRLLHALPFQSVVIADDKTVLTIAGAVGRHAAEQDFGFVYSGDRDQFPSAWFSRQFQRQDSSAIAFEDEVRV